MQARGFTAPAEASSRGGSETTHMTFTHPVRIPGATLPAGAYVFQLALSKHAVWIISEDDGKSFGPYLLLQRHRTGSDTKRKIIVTRSDWTGAAPTIRAWFGQYRQMGYEFIYPEAQ